MQSRFKIISKGKFIGMALLTGIVSPLIGLLGNIEVFSVGSAEYLKTLSLLSALAFGTGVVYGSLTLLPLRLQRTELGLGWIIFSGFSFLLGVLGVFVTTPLASWLGTTLEDYLTGGICISVALGLTFYFINNFNGQLIDKPRIIIAVVVGSLFPIAYYLLFTEILTGVSEWSSTFVAIWPALVSYFLISSIKIS